MSRASAEHLIPVGNRDLMNFATVAAGNNFSSSSMGMGNGDGDGDGQEDNSNGGKMRLSR